MGFLAETVRRAGYLLRKFRFDRELDEEIHFHIESRACELEAMGLSAGEALTQARREFGSDLRMRENTRSTWQVGWVEDLLSDLRYAVRSFRRNPTFAFTAIVCLALGIGANTTIFSLSMEMLFSRPSSRNPQRLVQLWVGGSSAASMRDYRFIRDSRLFDGLAGENEETEVNWREGSESRRLHTVVVTDNFFDVIGIPVAIGRPIEPREPDAVVITHGFWQRALGGDPNVVGRKLTLDGKPYTVSGVLPADHRTVTGFGFSPDLYLPVTSENAQVTLYARLPDWMTRQTAYAALKAVCQELDRTYPHGDKQWARAIRVLAVSGVDRFDNDEMVSIAAFFAMLLAVVWFVLLVACANVASMLLARGSSRAHELAVRFSLGASRSRIIRQLLAETLLLALCGTAAGLILNVELSSALSRVHLPLPVPFQLVIRPDLRLLWYSLAVSIACTLFAGLIPALKGARAGLNAALKKSRNQGGRSHMRLRNFMVVGQIVVSIVLLCAGLVFARNLLHAASMNPGFDVEHTIWSNVRLVPNDDANKERRLLVVREALDGLRSLPGVESASIARIVPLNGHLTNTLSIRTDSGSENHVVLNSNNVSGDYFKTMGIPIIKGREFGAVDRTGSARVAILNENLATRLFANTDPIGHEIYLESQAPVTVVGVAKNSKYFTLGEENALAWYAPYEQWKGSEELQFLIRGSGKREISLPAINRLLGSLDKTAAIDTKPMRSALVFAILPSRVGATVLGTIGLLGLALAAVGLYGTVSYSVNGRVQEIGLRAAIGATRGNIIWLVLRQSLILAFTGTGIGVALAIFVMPPLSAFLIPGVAPVDFVNFIIVGGVLCVVAGAATIAPTARALRVDPAMALRYE